MTTPVFNKTYLPSRPRILPFREGVCVVADSVVFPPETASLTASLTSPAMLPIMPSVVGVSVVGACVVGAWVVVCVVVVVFVVSVFSLTPLSALSGPTQPTAQALPAAKIKARANNLPGYFILYDPFHKSATQTRLVKDGAPECYIKSFRP